MTDPDEPRATDAEPVSGEPGVHVVARPAAIEVKATVGAARIATRAYLSSWLLRSARRFLSVAEEIESRHPEDWRSPHVEELLDHVVSSVVNAAMFMEAMVNELFADAHDGHGLTRDGYLAPLERRTIELMAAWWDESKSGFDQTLTKYQLLLAFADLPRLDPGAAPYQSAANLIVLRNEIVHFKPSTVFSDEQHRLERRLGGRFPINGLMPSGSGPWWPNAALGAGCAAWAISSAEALADEVARRLGIVPNYQRVRPGA